MNAENAAVESKHWASWELLDLADRQLLDVNNWLAGFVLASKQMQMTTMTDIMERLQDKKDQAVQEIANSSLPQNHLPLLPAIDLRSMRASVQMQMVRFRSFNGVSSLKDDQISDQVQMSEVAWWAIDVEKGDQFAVHETTPFDEKEELARQGRLCAVVSEAIAIGVHTDTLRYHGIYAIGSRYRGDRILHVMANLGGPNLVASPINLSQQGVGTASCLKRV
ncbi:MAG: hypothetical protein WCX71_03710 [Candidatus Buchananbacteria bacterium]